MGEIVRCGIERFRGRGGGSPEGFRSENDHRKFGGTNALQGFSVNYLMDRWWGRGLFSCWVMYNCPRKRGGYSPRGGDFTDERDGGTGVLLRGVLPSVRKLARTFWRACCDVLEELEESVKKEDQRFR